MKFKLKINSAPNLDAHDLFDRTFALEDEEEDEEFEEDALWNRTSSTEDDHEVAFKKFFKTKSEK